MTFSMPTFCTHLAAPVIGTQFRPCPALLHNYRWRVISQLWALDDSRLSAMGCHSHVDVCRAMAELLIALVQRNCIQYLQKRPALRSQRIPPPIIPGNLEISNPVCILQVSWIQDWSWTCTRTVDHREAHHVNNWISTHECLTLQVN